MVDDLSRKIRTPEDSDRFVRAIAQVDHAFWASEQKWGVGRLERLVSHTTLAAYQRGWDAYRPAIDDGDGAVIEVIGPKMIAALGFMDSEATAAGHKPIDPCVWEAPMGDGRVLVVVRTLAEATAVLRASREAGNGTFSGSPSMGQRSEPSTETNLPPDLAVTVRHQHEGRRLEVWSLAEIVRLIEAHGSLVTTQPEVGKMYQGTPAHSGVQMEEGATADTIRRGHPLPLALAGKVADAPSAKLDF